MALPKKIFKCVCVFFFFFFCDEMELPYIYLTATNNIEEFTGKSLLTAFCAKSSEKNRLKHHISRTEKYCDSEDHSEQFAGF